jgi:hypothetical protein
MVNILNFVLLLVLVIIPAFLPVKPALQITILQKFIFIFLLCYKLCFKKFILNPGRFFFSQYIKPLNYFSNDVLIKIDKQFDQINSRLETTIIMNSKDFFFGMILVILYCVILFVCGLLFCTHILIFNSVILCIWPLIDLTLTVNFLFLLCLISICIYCLLLLYNIKK